MDDHALAFWTMATSAISAACTVAATVIALYAATTWRAGLRQQRADEFVSALNDCAAAIGRTITRKQKNMQDAPGGLGVDEAWASWARLRTAYAVARRYYPRLDTDFPQQGSDSSSAWRRSATAPSTSQRVTRSTTTSTCSVRKWHQSFPANAQRA